MGANRLYGRADFVGIGGGVRMNSSYVGDQQAVFIAERTAKADGIKSWRLQNSNLQAICKRCGSGNRYWARWQYHGELYCNKCLPEKVELVEPDDPPKVVVKGRAKQAGAICKRCGERYWASSKKQAYCSGVCSHEARIADKPVTDRPRQRRTYKYAAHVGRATGERYLLKLEPSEHDLTCQYCQDRFTSLNMQRRYCSDECIKQASAMRRLARVAETWVQQ